MCKMGGAATALPTPCHVAGASVANQLVPHVALHLRLHVAIAPLGANLIVAPTIAS
jgi:hypothetical protein